MTTKLTGIDWMNKLDEANNPAGVAQNAVDIDAAETRLDLLERDYHTGTAVHVDFVVGAEGTNTVLVSMQLKDGDDTDLAVRGSVFAYLSDDANGDSIVATAPSGGWAITVDGVLIPIIAGKFAELISESDGDIAVTITETGTKTCYLVVVLNNGKIMVSGAIVFAA